MTAAWLVLVVYALATAFAGADLRFSREELYREFLEQLAPIQSYEATNGYWGNGLDWHDYEDVFAAPSYKRFPCSAPDVVEADKRTMCQPRKRFVKLPPVSTEILRLPRMVEMERCEGWCHEGGRSCQPSAPPQVVEVQVMKMNMTPERPQAQCAVEYLEKHAECSCMPAPQQMLLLPKFERHCPNLAERQLCSGPDRRWDSTTCQCSCEGECSTGFEYNNQECRCVPRNNTVSTSLPSQ